MPTMKEDSIESKPKPKPRRRRCSKCGIVKWSKKDFYGDTNTWCKECMKAYKREQYAKKTKKPDGIRYDAKSGHCWEHRGHIKTIHWSDAMKEKLRRMFPNHTTEDCAIELGVCRETIIRRAKELGLKKDPEWLLQIRLKGCKTMQVYNKCRGNRGQFKVGHVPYNKGIKKSQINNNDNNDNGKERNSI